MIYAPYAAKSLICPTASSSRANAVTKFACGVGIESVNQNRDYALRAAPHMAMIRMSLVL